MLSTDAHWAMVAQSRITGHGGGVLLTHLGHACVLVEAADVRILIDPGAFAGDFLAVADLGAIVITHQHPDHLDLGRIDELIRRNPSAAVYADPDSVRILTDRGIAVAPTPHEGTTLGAVTLRGVGQMHALIHEDIARIPNVGVVISAPGEPTFYHPGDALDADPGPVDILGFPLNAPWQRSREMTAFLRAHAAATAVPIHDGLLNETGRALYLSQAAALGSAATTIQDLRGAGTVTMT